MICSSTESSDFDSILGIPSSISVNNQASGMMVNVVMSQILAEASRVRIDRDVDFTPVYWFFCLSILDYSWILRLSTCLESRECAQCSIRANSWSSSMRIWWLLLSESNLVQLRYAMLKIINLGLKITFRLLMPCSWIDLIWGSMFDIHRITQFVLNIFNYKYFKML